MEGNIPRKDRGSDRYPQFRKPSGTFHIPMARGGECWFLCVGLALVVLTEVAESRAAFVVQTHGELTEWQRALVQRYSLQLSERRRQLDGETSLEYSSVRRRVFWRAT